MIDLDAFVNQAIKEVETAKKKGKRIKAKGITKEAKPKKPIEVEDPWDVTHLVCLVQRTVCRCCGERFIAPQPNLFVKRSRLNTMNHSEDFYYHKVTAYDASTVYSNLKKVVEYHDITIRICHNCFVEESENSTQMELFLELPSNILNQAYIFMLLLIHNKDIDINEKEIFNVYKS